MNACLYIVKVLSLIYLHCSKNTHISGHITTSDLFNMYTCHLKMSPKCFTPTAVVLFSASEQTQSDLAVLQELDCHAHHPNSRRGEKATAMTGIFEPATPLGAQSHVLATHSHRLMHLFHPQVTLCGSSP